MQPHHRLSAGSTAEPFATSSQLPWRLRITLPSWLAVVRAARKASMCISGEAGRGAVARPSSRESAEEGAGKEAFLRSSPCSFKGLCLAFLSHPPNSPSAGPDCRLFRKCWKPSRLQFSWEVEGDGRTTPKRSVKPKSYVRGE